MTAKHTYAAVAPNGKVITRTTTRAYTHAVLCQGNYEFDMQEAKCEISDRDGYRWMASQLAKPITAEPDSYKAHQLAFYASKIGDMTEEQYVANAVAGRIAKVEAMREAGRYEDWGQIGFCGRLSLAEKLLASYSHTARLINLTIVPVTLV